MTKSDDGDSSSYERDRNTRSKKSGPSGTKERKKQSDFIPRAKSPRRSTSGDSDRRPRERSATGSRSNSTRSSDRAPKDGDDRRKRSTPYHSSDRAPREGGDRRPRSGSSRSSARTLSDGGDRRPRSTPYHSSDRAPREGGDRRTRSDSPRNSDRSPRSEGDHRPRSPSYHSSDRAPREGGDRRSRSDSPRNSDRSPRHEGDRRPRSPPYHSSDRAPREGGDRRPRSDSHRSPDRRPRELNTSQPLPTSYSHSKEDRTHSPETNSNKHHSEFLDSRIPASKESEVPTIEVDFKSAYSKLDKKTKAKAAYINPELEFVPLNATNVSIIKSYFDSIHPKLYEKIAEKQEFSLYQHEGKEYDIFLVPNSVKKVVKKVVNQVAVQLAGSHLGYMRRKKTKTGFERAFYLSYEGGDFLLHLIQNCFSDISQDLQRITINESGAKTFLYGGEIKTEFILTDTSSLQKKKLIFVFDESNNYLGLAILIVRQAGTTNDDEKDSKRTEFSSRSKNFVVKLISLTDAGHFLRDGF